MVAREGRFILGRAFRRQRIPIFVGTAVGLALGTTMFYGAPARAPGSDVPPAGSRETGPVAGETYRWRPVAIGGGGFVTRLDMDRSGQTRVARTDVYGAYLWDAAADRWRQLVTAEAMPPALRFQAAFNEGVFEIAVAPGAPKRLFMAVKGRVLRSDDRGQHWIDPTRTGPFPLKFDPNAEFRMYGPFLAVSPVDPDLVLFGTPLDGLWRSADAGATWARIASVPAADDLRPDKPGVQAPGISIWFAPGRDDHTVFAGVPGHGVLVSHDRGLSFAPAAVGGPTTVMQATFDPHGAFDAVDQEGRTVWRLAAGMWTALSGEGRLDPAPFMAIAANSKSGSLFVTDLSGKSWCSPDQGQSWSRLIRTTAPGEHEPPWLPRISPFGFFAAAGMRFDPTVPGRLWVAAGTGPYEADVGDGCPLRLAWTSHVRGIEELVANDAVQPAGGAPLFAGWDFGIHVKPDLDSFSTTWGPKRRELISAQQLDWSPTDPRFIVTNASDARMCCAEDGDAVLAGYSTDGGYSWTKFATLPQPPGTTAEDPWRMSFGTIAVSARSVDNIVWAPAYNRSPYYTLDRGRTWQRVVLPGEVLPATGSYGTYFGGRKTLAADRVLPSTFYLVHSGDGANPELAGLWVTRDGGHDWNRVFYGEIAPYSNLSARLRAVPEHPGHLFFTTALLGGDDSWLRRSVDGGASWSQVAGVDRVDDVAFGKAAAGAGYPAIYLSGRVDGRYGIWRSVDNAATWQMLTDFPLGSLDQVSVIAADPNVFGRVYIGHSGSGWSYGEPAPCTHGGGVPDCHRVAAPQRATTRSAVQAD